jgi:FtsH-binding integral membrane protein
MKSSPKDVFMHILNIVGLYAGVSGVLVLLFQYINTAFPDVLNFYYDPGEPIRWALALVIVIFPVFIWSSVRLQKEISAEPEKNELKIRKWLLYLTIFAAGMLMIGDLVSLIYSFLQGEITVRFILKIASILAVAGAVFWHYLHILKRKPGKFSPKEKFFVWAVIAAVLAIVVAGFFVAGSPFKQRLIRFDEKKVNNLQEIQGYIVNYWMQKEALPETLEDLADSISGFKAPLDPQTGINYSYEKTGRLSFELCANFNLLREYGENGLRYDPVKPMSSMAYGPENWSHEAGDFCFEREIDPELYQKNNE